MEDVSGRMQNETVSQLTKLEAKIMFGLLIPRSYLQILQPHGQKSLKHEVEVEVDGPLFGR